MSVEDAAEAELGGETIKEGFEHVIEGYVRFSHVQFEWHKSLNPWQVNLELSIP